MNVIHTDIEGLVIIEPKLFKDQRGYFFESFSQREFDEKVAPVHFVQDNESKSSYGVVRGLHFQKPPYEQAKLVRCISGHVYDVIIDLRKNSPTFGKWQGFDLTGENRLSLYVPKHFGHGYLVIEDSVVSYQCDEVFYGEYDSGISWDDPDMGIQWPLDRIGGAENLIISEKDKNLQSFADFTHSLEAL